MDLKTRILEFADLLTDEYFRVEKRYKHWSKAKATIERDFCAATMSRLDSIQGRLRMIADEAIEEWKYE